MESDNEPAWEEGIDILALAKLDEEEIDMVQVVQTKAKQEAISYLVTTEGIPSAKFRALDWWKKHAAQFPIVSKLAQEWLGVPATSTPSERVFPVCGIVNSAIISLARL